VGNADYRREDRRELPAVRELGLGYANLARCSWRTACRTTRRGRAWPVPSPPHDGHAYAPPLGRRRMALAGFHDNAEPWSTCCACTRPSSKIDEDVVPPSCSRPHRRRGPCRRAAEQFVCATRRRRARTDRTIGCSWTVTPPASSPTSTGQDQEAVGGARCRSSTRPCACLAAARLQPGPGRRHRRLHRRAQDIVGAPTSRPSTWRCSPARWATNIHYSARAMMVVQPFISGAISKTVNMPRRDRRRHRTAPHRRLRLASRPLRST